MTPGLSIVVVPLLGGDALAACLDSLAADPDGAPAGEVTECIVVPRAGMAISPALREHRAAPVLLDGGNHPVPLRRGLGVAAARGEIVALLEDTSLPDAGWRAAIRAAFAEPGIAAAGGPVRIAPTLAGRFQALGWSEYGAFRPGRAPPAIAATGQAGPARLPGNNIAFRRAALREVLPPGAGLIEAEACAALRARGHRLAWQPGMAVTYAAPDRHGAALGTRLRHGRLYGAARAAGRGWGARLALAAKAPLLPGLLSARALAAMAGAVRPGAIPRLAFWLGCMESAWALGEALGSLAGAGDSLEAWR